MNPTTLGILASHGGTTMQAVIDACASDTLNANIGVVISNNSKSMALQRARNAKITTAHLSSANHDSAESLDRAIAQTLLNAGVDMLLLCGYMRKLGNITLQKFDGNIINTHPALLPKYGGQGFYGRRVHEAVIAAGDTESGATIHRVEAVYDSGEILAQARVPVHAGDTVEDLEERVKDVERRLLVATLATLTNTQEIRISGAP